MQLIKKIMMEILPWVPVVALVRIMGNLIRKKRGLGTTPWHEAGGRYIFPIHNRRNQYHRAAGFVSVWFAAAEHVNLIPFHGISIILRQNDTRYLLLNIIGNIVMFIPFGFFTPPALGQGTALYYRHNRRIYLFSADRIPAVFYQQGYGYRRFDTQYGRYDDRVSPLCRIPTAVLYVHIQILSNTAIRHGCKTSVTGCFRYSRLARAGCILARRPLILASFMAWSTSLAWA